MLIPLTLLNICYYCKLESTALFIILARDEIIKN